MVNPSINDYFRSKLKDNSLEQLAILNSAITVLQYRRLLSVEKADEKIYSLFETTKIDEFFFETEKEKNGYITYFISTNTVLNLEYKSYINNFLLNVSNVYDYGKSTVRAADVLVGLFDKKIFEFYGLDIYFLDLKILVNVLSNFELEHLPKVLTECYRLFEVNDDFVEICLDVINNAIDHYCDSIDSSAYDININMKLRENSQVVQYDIDEYESSPDIDAVIESAEDDIKCIVKEEIDEILNDLPGDLSEWFKDKEYKITIVGVEERFNYYYRDDYDEDARYSYDNTNSDWDIDLIFKD